MFCIQIDSHNDYGTASLTATCSLSLELEYIKPGHLSTEAVKELKRDQGEDIPFIRLPSFSPTFLAIVKIEQEVFNTNSEKARWDCLTTLADTTLADTAAHEVAQEAAQHNDVAEQTNLHNFMTKSGYNIAEAAGPPVGPTPD